LTRFWLFRLLSLVAALTLWLTVTGHTQESGISCDALEVGKGCQTARQSSRDGNEILASSAPNRPSVTYTNGKLTVAASNTSLAEVLRAISTQTGTVIDFPAGSAADRIVVREGPGTIRHVLTNLLNGSGFNYVILASPNAPDELTRVILATADQPANFSPQPANDQNNLTPDQPKTIRDPLLWTTPGRSSFLTSPKEDPSVPVLSKALDAGSLQPPTDPIPPDVLEQMMKDRAQQLREQIQQPQ
jgi:hypothetical protein